VQILKKFNGGSMQNKRIIAVFILLVFCAALAIGGSAVFTIAEVEASYTLLSNEQKEEIDNIDMLLDGFEGKNIMFLKNSEIENTLSSYTYLKITEIKKVYPNSIIVEIEERKEVFAIFYSEKYFMLDKDGFVISEKTLNQNNIDVQPNVVLEVEGTVTVGSYAEITDAELFGYLLYIAKTTDKYFYDINHIDNIRNMVVKISIVNGMNINLQMSDGLVISIKDASKKSGEKLLSALNVYNNDLTPEERAAHNAKIIAVCDNNGIISSAYSINSH
jgi:hypothetical protein